MRFQGYSLALRNAMSSTDGSALSADAHSMDALKYRAFISYSHRDSRWASWLHASLEKYRPPKPLIGTQTVLGMVPKRIAPIFRDRDELPSATDLGTLVNAALADSASQIVICSPQAAKSKWVNEEILSFKRLGRAGDRIFCLIVGMASGVQSRYARTGRRRVLPAGTTLSPRTGRAELRRSTHRTDRGGRAPRQATVSITMPASSLHLRTSRRRLRYLEAARAAAAQSPPVCILVCRDGWHGADQRSRRVCTHPAWRGTAPDGARRGRSAHRPGDHAFSGRSVQDLRPQRGARQYRDGAGDARQGCLEN